MVGSSMVAVGDHVKVIPVSTILVNPMRAELPTQMVLSDKVSAVVPRTTIDLIIVSVILQEVVSRTTSLAV